jgi:hypothetical protein
VIDANFLQAASIAEKIAPYRHARLSAMKLVGDPNAPKDLEDSASLEELKAMVEFHLERVAPLLDFKVIPINGTDTEPRDGIANYDAPQGRAGNDAEAPQGRRRASVDTITINRYASLASRLIVMAQPATNRWC